MIAIKSVDEVLALYAGDDRLAFLLNAKEVLVREVVSGEFYVQFAYPFQTNDAERYGLLVEGNDVQFPEGIERGQKFRIRNVQEVRQGRKIYKVVEAHHIAFTLGNYFLDDYIDFAAAKTLPAMLTLLGANTPFSFAVEGSFPSQDIFDWGEKTKFELLQELRKLYNAELYFDNYEITLTTRKGGNYGARIEYQHNMKGIKRKSHDMERITRLYGYGKNGLTIEGHSGIAVKYIDSLHFDPTTPFMGKVEFPDIETQARLLEEMQKYLVKHELPSVTYDVDFIQMEKIDCEFLDERIREAGDTVTCFDEVLGYSFDARANDFDRYPFEKKSGRAALTNFREMKTSDYIFQATVGSKKAIEYTSKNAVLKGQKYDDSITLVDGFGMRVSDDQNRTMVRLGQTAPGEYGLALFNKSGVRTIWQDSSTGNAYFSGTLQAATISGGTITGSSISGGTISGTFINGTFINGGTITGAQIQTTQAGQFPRAEMSNMERMFKVETSDNSKIEMRSIGTTNSSPSLEFINGSSDTYMRQSSDQNTGLYISGKAIHIELNRITLRGYNGVRFLGWSSIISEGLAPGSVVQTLQQALDAKADSSRIASLEARVTALEAR